MSAPIDESSQGGANGVRSVPGASAEVEQGGLSPNGGRSPPAQWQEAIEEEIGEEEAASTPSTASKRPADPVTTARSAKKAKKSAADKIGKGRRVSCRKQTLWHIVKSSTEEGKAQQQKIQGFPPGYRLYGTVKSGSGKKGYVVAFDVFPAEAREVVVLRRQLKLLPVGADEPDFEYKADSSDDDDTDDDTPQKKKKKKLSPEQQSIQDFTGLKKDVLAKATAFNFAYGKKEDEKIEWAILPCQEQGWRAR